MEKDPTAAIQKYEVEYWDVKDKEGTKQKVDYPLGGGWDEVVKWFRDPKGFDYGGAKRGTTLRMRILGTNAQGQTRPMHQSEHRL